MDLPEYETAQAMLSIDPEDLDSEFTEAPDILAFFVNKYAIAQKAYLRARMSFEQTEARLKIAQREKLTRAAKAEFARDRQIEDSNVSQAKANKIVYKRVDVKYNRPTSAEVDNAVMVDPEYTDARLRYIEAECDATRIKGWCDVGRVKKDMLTNLGMRVNAELRGAGWTPSATHRAPTTSSGPPKPMPFGDRT